jgi:hypothetical protein
VGEGETEVGGGQGEAEGGGGAEGGAVGEVLPELPGGLALLLLLGLILLLAVHRLRTLLTLPVLLRTI